MAEKEECGLCRFWEGSGMAEVSDAGIQLEVSSCRRHAPTLKIVCGRSTAQWPGTYLTDFCGDFEPYTSSDA